MRTIFSLLASLMLIAPVLAAAAAPAQPANPLLAAWKTPFGVPPFDAIRTEHFMPAYTEAFRQHDAEIAAIVASLAAPTFDNTIAALDDCGELLSRVNGVFGALSGAETSEALQAVEEKVRPALAAHSDDVNLNEALFKRVKAVYETRATLTLTPEQSMLLEKTFRRFVRGGANLDPEQRKRLRAINGELSGLIVRFGANLLKETNDFKLVIEKKDDLAGLPEGQVAAAAEAAAQAGLPGKWVFTLKAPSIWPFLQSSSSRELRKRILAAYSSRCDHGGETDNTLVFASIARLRVEKAQLLGYRTWANFVLDEYMAKTPENVYALLGQLWAPAQARARREAADIQAMIDAEHGGFALEPCDWRYYAERVKKAKYDLDEEAIRPYLQLDAVRDGAFTLAGRLYGVTFTRLTNLPLYNPEVQGFEVKEKDGRHLGVLAMDFHPRPGKRGGAWCSTLRDQWIRDGVFVTPVVYNVFNFTRPSGSTPALLTPEEAETLFHEFGHALHALFSSCRFRGSGSFVPQDFVELPSQVMESWVFEPEMLALYAKNFRTGEVIPPALVARIRNAATFNQGFANTEVLAASLLDMDWHTLSQAKLVDTTAFETASLAKWGLIPQILPRYRTTYFHHAADEYSAGYYSYTWSAVLDADAFAAFKETGNLFDQATAQRFRALLAAGGSEDAMLLWKRFRGREPKVDALLVKRGLTGEPAK